MDSVSFSLLSRTKKYTSEKNRRGRCYVGSYHQYHFKKSIFSRRHIVYLRLSPILVFSFPFLAEYACLLRRQGIGVAGSKGSKFSIPPPRWVETLVSDEFARALTTVTLSRDAIMRKRSAMGRCYNLVRFVTARNDDNGDDREHRVGGYALDTLPRDIG